MSTIKDKTQFNFNQFVNLESVTGSDTKYSDSYSSSFISLLSSEDGDTGMVLDDQQDDIPKMVEVEE